MSPQKSTNHSEVPGTSASHAKRAKAKERTSGNREEDSHTTFSDFTDSAYGGSYIYQRGEGFVDDETSLGDIDFDQNIASCKFFLVNY